jgi:hypothetical protein
LRVCVLCIFVDWNILHYTGNTSNWWKQWLRLRNFYNIYRDILLMSNCIFLESVDIERLYREVIFFCQFILIGRAVLFTLMSESVSDFCKCFSHYPIFCLGPFRCWLKAWTICGCCCFLLGGGLHLCFCARRFWQSYSSFLIWIKICSYFLCDIALK